ncbi:M16 family metallopeptidase [Moraxella oblonga]|uniref:M16 family metallopeptidase n=1 Tax=Moraxella oblonga TaxID=200413 RepID=UPI00082DADE0|nr:pitrilysin family protein [Moraxella oblonga]
MKKSTIPLLTLVLACHVSTAWADRQPTITKETTQPLPALDSLNDDKPLDLTIPKMKRFVIDGVSVIFTHVDELPILDISLTFKGGSAKDSTIKKEGYGIADMTATMMTQGTTSLDENEFAEQAELLGATFGATARQDTFSYGFRSLSEDKELYPALDLFIDMIKNPRFDETILKRNQAQADIGFEFAKQDPSHLAHVAFLETMYGNHPYAVQSSGTQKSVATISRDDLINYKNHYLTKNNVHIAITGDISMDNAHAIAKRLIEALPQGERVSDLPTPTPPKPQHVHIPYDSTQTHIYIGHMGEKDTKDPTELQNRTNFSLANSVLAGGDFNAYLMKEIRDKGGYTYGITGGMTTFDERGYYLINFSTQTDKAKEAIVKTLDVINDVRKNGIKQHDFELERTSRKYAYPMSLATNLAIHHTASHLNYDNLPDSHITDYLVRLDKATLNQANASLNQYIRPNEFIIITIGKQKPDLSDVLDKLAK